MKGTFRQAVPNNILHDKENRKFTNYLPIEMYANAFFELISFNECYECIVQRACTHLDLRTQN